MLEAAACGLPMILTSVGGATTVVEDGANGFIVPNDDDVTVLEQAMRMACKPECLAALAQSASARRWSYSLEAMVTETERLYRSLSR